MKYIISSILAVFFICLNISFSYATQYDLKDPEIMATINGKKISAKTFAFFAEQLKKANKFKSNDVLLRDLIANQVLAESYSNELKIKNKEFPIEENKKLEEEYIFLLRNLLALKDDAAILKDAQKFVIEKNVNMEKIKASFLQSQKGMLLDLDKIIKKDEAQKLIILKYKFQDGKEEFMTFYDFYNLQNAQEKMEILNGNQKFIEDAVKKKIVDKYIIHSANNSREKHFNEAYELKTIIENKYMANAYLASMGIRGIFVSNDNPKLAERASNIPKNKILNYYNKNKEKYKQVKEVEAYHIRLKDEDTANDVYKKITKGNDFSKMVKEYSIAPDKNEQKPGKLPLIKNSDSSEIPFLHKIALIQKQGEVSQPFNTPDGYEIILVTKRTEEYRAPNESGLMHEISRKIALEDILKEYHEKEKSLMKSASININKNLLGGKLKDEI